MKKIKITLAIIALATLANTGLVAQAQTPAPQVKVEVKQKISLEVITGVKPPSQKENELMHAEEMQHPKIIKALIEIKNAMRALNETPDDFGGYKKEALQDLEKSYISLRKALYFRLLQDTKK